MLIANDNCSFHGQGAWCGILWYVEVVQCGSCTMWTEPSLAGCRHAAASAVSHSWHILMVLFSSFFCKTCFRVFFCLQYRLLRHSWFLVRPRCWLLWPVRIICIFCIFCIFSIYFIFSLFCIFCILCIFCIFCIFTKCINVVWSVLVSKGQFIQFSTRSWVSQSLSELHV